MHTYDRVSCVVSSAPVHKSVFGYTYSNRCECKPFATLPLRNIVKKCVLFPVQAVYLKTSIDLHYDHPRAGEAYQLERLKIMGVCSPCSSLPKSCGNDEFIHGCDATELHASNEELQLN